MDILADFETFEAETHKPDPCGVCDAGHRKDTNTLLAADKEIASIAKYLYHKKEWKKGSPEKAAIKAIESAIHRHKRRDTCRD